MGAADCRVGDDYVVGIGEGWQKGSQSEKARIAGATHPLDLNPDSPRQEIRELRHGYAALPVPRLGRS